jgi:tRNA pseudouridine38-40 synthase
MSRYFIELAYNGKQFSGFQKQENARTIQGEVDKAFRTILRSEIETTTSSRTDAGVHAVQNFLHFDTDKILPVTMAYNANAILPKDIVVKSIREVTPESHSRFNAQYRTYEYMIYQEKNPFLTDLAYFYPFPLDKKLLSEAAAFFKKNTDFQSFCKRHAEVNHYQCNLSIVNWTEEKDYLKFTVRGNRFLRGMVRALVGTSLQIARGNIDINTLPKIVQAHDSQQADFSAAAHGLKLLEVGYPEEIFISKSNL